MDVLGLSQTQIGIVVGSLDIADLAISFFVASFVSSNNIKFLFSTGILWSSFSVGAFGLLGDSPDGTVYFMSCLATRIFNGLGAAMLYGTASPIAMMTFPERIGVITAITQSSLGLGLCIGPPIGSVLIPLGGYKTPFIAVALVEFLVYLASIAILPSRGSEQNKSKFRASSYIKFIFKFSTMSVVIPGAAITCISGVRDTAYSLYFTDVLGIDSETVGYLFIANSVAFLLTCPLVGLVVELGFGPFLIVFCQLTVPLNALGFFLPKYFPKLQSIPWSLTLLFLNGFFAASMMNPIYLILEKVALKEGLRDRNQIKTIVASTFNLIYCVGLTIGSFLIGGYLNDQVGFYYMSLSYTGLLTITAIWHLAFLYQNNFIRRLFYDTHFESDDIEFEDKSEKDDEKEENSLISRSNMTDLILLSLTRSEYLQR